MKLFGLCRSIFIPASLGVLLGITASCLVPIQSDGAATKPLRTVSGSHAPELVEGSHEYVPYQRMLAEADVIVAAQVASIGKTKWNQDNGDYWEETLKKDGYETIVSALPYYEVTFVVEEILSDSRNLLVEPKLTLIVLGTSPSDNEVSSNQLALQPGDQVVVFSEQREIGWRTRPATYDEKTTSIEVGRKQVMTFMGAPGTSHLVKEEDGLFHAPPNAPEQFTPISLDALRASVNP